jgi:ABC-type transporter Mla MlaB component
LLNKRLAVSIKLTIPTGACRAFVKSMLRITTQTRADSLSLRLEGRLKGPWVDELAKAWSALAKTTHGMTITVDLHSVSFLDPTGCDLLLRLQQEGAVLEGASTFVNGILERKIEQSQKLGKRSKK